MVIMKMMVRYHKNAMKNKPLLKVCKIDPDKK